MISGQIFWKQTMHAKLQNIHLHVLNTIQFVHVDSIKTVRLQFIMIQKMQTMYEGGFWLSMKVILLSTNYCDSS